MENKIIDLFNDFNIILFILLTILYLISIFRILFDRLYLFSKIKKLYEI